MRPDDNTGRIGLQMYAVPTQEDQLRLPQSRVVKELELVLPTGQTGLKDLLHFFFSPVWRDFIFAVLGE